MRLLAFGVLALTLSGCVSTSSDVTGRPAEKNDVSVNLEADSVYDVYFCNGTRAFDQKLWALTITDETKAIQRDPRLYAAYVNRGAAYAHEGNFQADIADQTQAIAMAGKYDGGSYSDTVSNDNPLKPHPTPVVIYPAYANRAEAYVSTGQYALAVADDSEAIALNPSRPSLYNDRCWARAKQGDLANALQDCNHGLVLAPENAEILGSRGYVYLKMQNYDTSIADYNAALAIAPKQASSLYGLGLALRAKNDPSADAKIAAAEKIDPNVASVFNK
jgi:tetratricopeptide (TPR) repeat protein